MSEENKNDNVPAVEAENEAVLPTEIVDELESAVEKLSVAVKEEEIAAEAVVEAEIKVKEIAADLNFKPQISVVEESEDKNVISSGSQKRSKPSDLSGLTGVTGGVIGTGSVKRKPVVKQPAKSEEDKVAIHSTRNVSWVGVGKIIKGYNIVTKDQADKWLTRDHTRLVSPQEVAQGFNS